MSKKNNNDQKTNREFIFQKKNYLFLFIGIAFITLGFILVLIGLGIQIYAILLNPNKNKE